MFTFVHGTKKVLVRFTSVGSYLIVFPQANIVNPDQADLTRGQGQIYLKYVLFLNSILKCSIKSSLLFSYMEGLHEDIEAFEFKIRPLSQESRSKDLNSGCMAWITNKSYMF